MPELSTLGTFIAVVLGLFLIPGPAVLLVFARTVQGGRKTGILTGLGIATGDFVHTLAAAVGLSALLHTSALAFSAVKYAGAGYLIYLGIRAFLEKPRATALPEVAATAPAKSFFQAVLVEVLNPKTALFFLAFLPQFVQPVQGPPMAQLMLLGLIFVVMSALYTTLLVLAVRPLGCLCSRLSWLGRRQGKIAGTIFILLGLQVALQRQ